MSTLPSHHLIADRQTDSQLQTLVRLTAPKADCPLVFYSPGPALVLIANKMSISVHFNIFCKIVT